MFTVSAGDVLEAGISSIDCVEEGNECGGCTPRSGAYRTSGADF